MRKSRRVAEDARRLEKRLAKRSGAGRKAYTAISDPSHRLAVMVRAVEPEYGVSRRRAADWVIRATAPGFAICGVVGLFPDGTVSTGVEVSSAVRDVSSFAVKVNSLVTAADRIFQRASLAEQWRLTHEISACRSVIRGMRENRPTALKAGLTELRTLGWGPFIAQLLPRAVAVGTFTMPRGPFDGD